MTSPFHPGGYVAIINTHWTRRIESKRRILKVHKNGNFTLAYPEQNDEGRARLESQQWRPGAMGHAHRTGERSYGSSHAEPWTTAHDAERRYVRQQHDLRARLGKVAKRIDELAHAGRAELTVDFIADLEAAMLKDYERREAEYAD